MPGDAIGAVILALAIGPAVLYWLNTWSYRRAPDPDSEVAAVSVLIPARNEERTIAAAIECALVSRGVDLEVVVLNDHSEDSTASIVTGIAAKDRRVRLLDSGPLPDGWCGKQCACHQLADHALHQLLLFIDADVRLAPDAIGRLVRFLQESKADLISGVPRQETETLLERLVIPLIHFVLLGFLPFAAMRRFRCPAFGAGCGQLFLARQSSYEKAGGHATIKSSRHDGVTLPRTFRRAGFITDLCDATDLATCRMYQTGAELWKGFAKNAGEGLGSPRGIVPWTFFLVGGQVAPFALLPFEPLAAWVAIAAGFSMRIHAAVRFRQSWLGAILHPVGVVILLTIQWHALICRMLGRAILWKGRANPTAPSKSQVDAPGVGVSDSPT
jgi:Glycosyl transferase family 2